MKLPSSSSLLLASLAVSASSSSSLSALAAPAGDLTSGSSSPDPVGDRRDGAVTRSLGAPFGSASTFFSDMATDHPQSRDSPIAKLLGDLVNNLDGLLGLHLRDSGSDSTSPDSTTPPPGPPAPPSTPAMPDSSNLPDRPSTSPDPPAKD